MVTAQYEYDAYGQLIRAAGTFADANPFRFSTKYYDEETRFYYYGYRYYDPYNGRWLSRDPIGKAGGLNLYGFVGNDPVNRWDYLGLRTIQVNDCEAYLVIDHGSKVEGKTIDWELKGRCAIGGAVVCYPSANQPVDPYPESRNKSFPDPIWPGVPRLFEACLTGGLSEAAKNIGRRNADAAALLEEVQLRDPDVEGYVGDAVRNALSPKALRKTVTKLISNKCDCSCKKITITIDASSAKPVKQALAEGLTFAGRIIEAGKKTRFVYPN